METNYYLHNTQCLLKLYIDYDIVRFKSLKFTDICQKSTICFNVCITNLCSEYFL